jgi:hypothetical protein
MLPVIGVARAVPPFTRGFDCLSPVTNQVARLAKASGFDFVGRYLHNLSTAERDAIFDADLALWPLTYAPTEEPLTAATGAAAAARDVLFARALAIPPGIHITLDYESPAPGSNGPAHLNAASHALRAAGYADAVYVGGPEDLSSASLSALLTTRYCKGGGRVPEPARGWCMLQLEPLDQVMFGGQDVDVDVAKADYHGDGLTLWYPS